MMIAAMTCSWILVTSALQDRQDTDILDKAMTVILVIQAAPQIHLMHHQVQHHLRLLP